MNLGRLIDTGRLVPWLRTIVRNEAYMKLSRGGPHGKERPVWIGGEPGGSGRREPGWENVDRILSHVIQSVAQSSEDYADPAARLMRKELFEAFRELLHCLTKRERAIFEAFFFQQLPPEEIASLYNTTTKRVYNSIFRSRQKVQCEWIRVTIKGYLAIRREKRKPRRILLDSSVIPY